MAGNSFMQNFLCNRKYKHIHFKKKFLCIKDACICQTQLSNSSFSSLLFPHTTWKICAVWQQRSIFSLAQKLLAEIKVEPTFPPLSGPVWPPEYVRKVFNYDHLVWPYTWQWKAPNPFHSAMDFLPSVWPQPISHFNWAKSTPPCTQFHL